MPDKWWQKVEFDLGGELADAADQLLESLGALAVSHQPAGGEDRFDLAEPNMQNWNRTRVCALFDENADLSPVLDAITAILPVTGADVAVERFADRDWERSWLEQFHPLKISDRLWVCPSWCEAPDPAAANIVLDPGLAFGTGTHATTFLCLEQLASMDLTGRRVLDYGCGSGILAIGALMLGAETALATDIDPRALDATRRNAEANGVGQRLQVLDHVEADAAANSGNLRSDVVIANILADALVALSGRLSAALRREGTLMLSGILADQQDRVARAFPDHRFTIRPRQEWILMTAVDAARP